MTSTYATLLYSDSYLPGAKVLGHQLSKLDAERHRVALVTQDVSQATRTALCGFWDEIRTVDTFALGNSQVLASMNRPELLNAPTKIELWRLPFDQVMYLDADTLPLAIPEKLFEPLEAGWIAAAPDSGWPDIFNSGVLSLRPNDNTYDELLQFGASFDGSDQGLLNEYFAGKWKRIPFTHNVTVNGGYQYLPAFRHFQQDIRILHYIGPQKPWDGLPSPEWHQAFNDIALEPHSLPKEAKSDTPPSWNPENIIEPPVDYWDAATHAPLASNRPEGEDLNDSSDDTSPAATHVFPALGPTVVDLPFEKDQMKAERVFE